MTIAVNPSTGEALTLEGEQWVPAKVAVNPQTGEKLALDGAEWKPLAKDPAVARQPSLDQRLTASVPYRFAQGVRNPLDAFGQIVPQVLSKAASTVGLDKAAEYLSGDTKFLGMDIGTEAIDKTIRERADYYQKARSATGAKPEDWDVAAGVGEVVGTLPLALVSRATTAGNSLLGLAGAGLLGGALSGALTPITNEKDQQDFFLNKTAQTGMGAAGGLVLGPVVGKSIQGITALATAIQPYAAAALDTITGKGAERIVQATQKAGDVIASAMREIGQDISDIPAAQYAILKDLVSKSLASGKNLNPAALLRKADFEAAGMPATLGQITRDPSQYAKEQNLRGVAGIGEPIMDVLNAQTRKAQTDIADIAKGGGIDAVKSGQNIAKVLTDFDEVARKKVTAEYAAARDSSGKSYSVPLGGLAYDVAQIIDNFGDKVPSAIVAKIKSFGMLDTKQTRVFDFEEADKLIKVINQFVGMDKTTNLALGQLRDSVKRAMMDADVPDVFAPARDAARARFQLQSQVPALEAAASGELNPDKFIQKYVFGAPTGDSVRLANLLKQESPESFTAAQSELGAIIKRAAFGEDPASDAALKPAALAAVLRNLGPQKLEAWFGSETADQLTRLARVGGYATSIPGRAAVSTSNSNPASMIANYGGIIPGSDKLKLLAGVVQPILNQRAVQTAVRAEVPRLDQAESLAISLGKILAAQQAGRVAADSVTNPPRQGAR